MPKGSTGSEQTTKRTGTTAEQLQLLSINECLSLEAKPRSNGSVVCLDEDHPSNGVVASCDGRDGVDSVERARDIEDHDYANRTDPKAPTVRRDPSSAEAFFQGKSSAGRTLAEPARGRVKHYYRRGRNRIPKSEKTEECTRRTARGVKGQKPFSLRQHRNKSIQTELVSTNTAGSANNRLPRDAIQEEDYYYTTGENSRCNCSGRRRSTLAALIELFEQKVKVNQEELSDCSPTISISTLKRNKSKGLRSNVPESGAGREFKADIEGMKMRNIITPVKYDPTTSTEDDSLEYCATNGNDLSHQYHDKLLHHYVHSEQVPVFVRNSSNLKRKLTKTNWQPPTNGSQYEHKLKPAICSHGNGQKAINNSYEANQHSPYQERGVGVIGGPTIVKHQPSSSRRLLAQLARLRRLSEPNYNVKRPEKVAQVESLIEQLERATSEWAEDESLLDRADRRDWPTKYQERYMRRGDSKEEQVDLPAKETDQGRPIEEEEEASLSPFGRRSEVDSLETKTIDRSHSIYNLHMTGIQPESWSANSTLNRHLQGRPRAYADRYFDDLAVRRLTNRPTSSASSTCRPYSPHMGSRDTADQTVQMSYLLCSNAYTPTIDTSRLSLGPTLEHRIMSDDLHFRNVKPKKEPYQPPFGIPRQEIVGSSHSSASHYLRQTAKEQLSTSSPRKTCVCTLNSENKSNEVVQQRIRPESKVSFVCEAGSGRVSADSGLVAGSSPVSTQTNCMSPTKGHPLTSPATNTSPSPNFTRQSKLLCDSSSQTVDYEYVNDLGEVDLNQELNKVRLEPEAERYSTSNSPTVERHKAELVAEPTKSRPKINIQNPRAKSPLLRISRKTLSETKTPNKESPRSDTPVQIQCYEDTLPRSSSTTSKLSKPMSELEIKYDFQDEDDEDDLIESMTTVPARRIITTDTSESGLSNDQNESSLERLNYRGEPIKGKPKGDSNINKQDGPIFSIGEYKFIDKTNLIFL